MGFGKRLLFLSFLDLLEACLGHVSTAIPPLLHTVIQLIRTGDDCKALPSGFIGIFSSFYLS